MLRRARSSRRDASADEQAAVNAIEGAAALKQIWTIHHVAQKRLPRRGGTLILTRMQRLISTLSVLLPLMLLAGVPAIAQTAAPRLALALTGAPVTVFSPQRDACDGNDVPDAPLRAFRTDSGGVAAFGLHYVNRALRGPDIEHLRIDCHVVLGSHASADPRAYDDKSWITATWTQDGRTVDALIHHEWQGNTHPGTCAFQVYMQCWWNAVLGARSDDAGADFTRGTPPVVVAATPFGQEKEQGRHRGFFNPSNIFSDGSFRYFYASTTGWPGQQAGVCLFRTATSGDAASWRAWDGRGFSARFGDPYRGGGAKAGTSCQPIAPFPAPVGSVVRHRGSGLWLAVFQASRDEQYFPLAGLYYATSANLFDWSAPRLIIPGKTLYDDPCTADGKLISYPSLIDPAAKGRNFDDSGDTAELFFATYVVKGCDITSQRDLVRVPVSIRMAR